MCRVLIAVALIVGTSGVSFAVICSQCGTVSGPPSDIPATCVLCEQVWCCDQFAKYDYTDGCELDEDDNGLWCQDNQPMPEGVYFDYECIDEDEDGDKECVLIDTYETGNVNGCKQNVGPCDVRE